MARPPKSTEHAAEQPAQCPHCGPLLAQLSEIARLLRLGLPHEGLADGVGKCQHPACWCAATCAVAQ